MSYNPHRALELLRQGTVRPNVFFREGQEEAIRYVVDGRGRLLVVQKTGWGKSFVYFIATKLLRESGNGLTLLISPLLALRNIAEAQGGISAIAEKAHLNRENLYRMLSKQGNPEIKSLMTLLNAMGLALTVKAQKQVYA